MQWTAAGPDIALTGGAIKPPVIAVYVYVDVMGVWYKRPLTAQRLRWLSGQCSHPLLAPPYLVRRPARFDPRYVNYTRLLQPSKAVLEWLADLDDIKMTYGELARDHIYLDEHRCHATGMLFCSSLVQRRHGNKRTMLFVQGFNGNTGTRKPGITFCWYTTMPSKITGEVNNFHLEARLCGSRTLHRHGIWHPRDLLTTFDHDEFWQEQWCKRLTLVTLDRARFGRWHDNRLNGTRRQTSTHEDYRRGCLLYRIYGQAGEGGFSPQGVWDQFGRGPSYIHGDLRELLCPELTATPELVYPTKQPNQANQPNQHLNPHSADHLHGELNP